MSIIEMLYKSFNAIVIQAKRSPELSITEICILIMAFTMCSYLIGWLHGIQCACHYDSKDKTKLK